MLFNTTVADVSPLLLYIPKLLWAEASPNDPFLVRLFPCKLCIFYSLRDSPIMPTGATITQIRRSGQGLYHSHGMVLEFGELVKNG